MKRLLLAFLLMSGLMGCTRPYDTYVNFDPEKAKGVRYEYEGDTVRCDTPEMTLEVTYLPAERLDLYFSKFKDGKYINPFTPDSFMVFSVALENKGKANLLYNPRMTLLLQDKGESLHIKDYSSLYTDFEIAGADDAMERMKAYKASCLDGTITLAPGEKARGLLVFPRRKDAKAKKVGLLMDSIYMGRDRRSVPILFKQPLTVDE